MFAFHIIAMSHVRICAIIHVLASYSYGPHALVKLFCLNIQQNRNVYHSWACPSGRGRPLPGIGKVGLLSRAVPRGTWRSGPWYVSVAPEVYTLWVGPISSKGKKKNTLLILKILTLELKLSFFDHCVKVVGLLTDCTSFFDHLSTFLFLTEFLVLAFIVSSFIL